ncbi:hypothetical protein JL108_17645 [Aeromicrobium sp. YIM 150415]|uniref:hypothetical protein n=1 Tax=Aeromicrobium sp. YIM 150415 TaxID=2803912 RepID=UPI0019648258|nr:hypothetical protein [Aeromicrobium sp. YIM 150415]MBM9465276.1 hypothetical protein [Aeromicrobium sp. YIM 150415]
MSAWDEIVERVERHIAGEPTPHEHWVGLCEAGIAERSIDPELRPADTARWIAGLLAAYQSIRVASDAPRDTDIADLLMILTRWLHPARPRGIATH